MKNNRKKLFIFCVFCIFLSFPNETDYYGKPEEAAHEPTIKQNEFRYLRYGVKKTPKEPEKEKFFWPMPQVEVIDFDEYVQRAENLCGEYPWFMSDIEALSGNPEMAIQICLQEEDYECAFYVATEYQDFLSYKSEYDPYNILRKAEEDDETSRYWLANSYEKLKVLDRAEELYKEIGSGYAS